MKETYLREGVQLALIIIQIQFLEHGIILSFQGAYLMERLNAILKTGKEMKERLR